MKIRCDFVSNSSSSSYIVSSVHSPKAFGRKIMRCALGDTRRVREEDHWVISNGPKLGNHLATHSCFSVQEIRFDIPLTDEQCKTFYKGEGKPNTIFGGECCTNDFLKENFDKNGQLKDSTNLDKILNAITAYRIENGKVKLGQINDGWVNGRSGQITPLSIKVNRWLLDAIMQKYPGCTIQDKDKKLKLLDDIERDLKNYHMYYLTINHDGDGVDEDAAYYSTYDDYGYDVGWDYYDLVERKGIVNNMIYAESM